MKIHLPRLSRNEPIQPRLVSKAPSSPGASWLSALQGFFAPAPPIPLVVHTEEETSKAYRYWQRRVLIATIIGYALYYFVRKNLSIAMPAMGRELGITKSDLGMFLSLHGVIYGLSRFVNGALADRTNARSMMTAGLVLSAVMNICFGLSSAVIAFGVFWMINGWVQGLGFPPCARLMTHWFSPKVLASRMSVWNTSHSIGAGVVVIMCGYLAVIDWRLCFFVPAALALMGGVYLWITLRDTPPSVGLPEVKGTENYSAFNVSPAEHRSFVKTHVFLNPYMWLFALANFFVYIVRYAVLDWGPTLLSEAKGYRLEHAAGMVASFEISGVTGMLLAGWFTDRIFGGRGGRVCLFCMAGAGAAIFLFWRLPAGSWVMSTVLLCLTGFFIYGPQALIGIAVANLATKRAAATAAGFTGIFGYASTVFSGWGMGYVVEKYGWNTALTLIVVASAIGTLLFAATWRAKAHGYQTD